MRRSNRAYYTAGCAHLYNRYSAVISATRTHVDAAFRQKDALRASNAIAPQLEMHPLVLDVADAVQPESRVALLEQNRLDDDAIGICAC